MKLLSTALLALAAMNTTGLLAANATKPLLTHATDNTEIRLVMSRFQQAIKDKKSGDILALFLNADAPVTASASDAAAARVRAKKPDAPKILPSTSKEFATSIGTDKDASEEIFSNIKIDSDDAVASASFDFVYLSNGEKINLGKEAWLLVKTDEGWKISAIVFSMNFPKHK